MGADKAVIVDDEVLAGSDALTTSRILAAAIEREGFDLVIAGTESTDGYTGVVPQQIAELLDVPSLTFARKVDAADGVVRIEQQTAGGYDVVEATASGAALGDLGRRRAPLPHLQGDHAGEDRSRSTHSRRKTSASPRPGR